MSNKFQMLVSLFALLCHNGAFLFIWQTHSHIDLARRRCAFNERLLASAKDNVMHMISSFDYIQIRKRRSRKEACPLCLLKGALAFYAFVCFLKNALWLSQFFPASHSLPEEKHNY
ncbi:hypothetical protein E2542_SST31326 [Spatholobus suberectus]|nr:hypothetical protein E2542_SST31326 [Spatholobus suberectus]